MKKHSNGEELKHPLHGAWKVDHLIMSGNKADVEEEGPEFLWFREGTFITGDQWAAWEVPYSLVQGSVPAQIDVIRTDLNEPWKQLGIYEVHGDELRMCFTGTVADERPSEFGSNSQNERVLYLLKRCNEPIPE